MTAPVPELVDLEAIAHLDQPMPACERPECRAGHPPATHVVRSRFPCRCWSVVLVCDRCAEGWRRFLARRGGRVLPWCCSRCHRRHLSDLARLITVDPL